MIGGSVDRGIDSSVDVDLGAGTDIDKDVKVVFPKENECPSFPLPSRGMWRRANWDI